MKLKINNETFIKRALIVYHIVFSIICYYFTAFDNKESDYEKYIRLANNLEWYDLFGFGNKFVSFLIYPLVKLGFGYFFLTLLFSTIGLQGFLIFYKLYKKDNFKYNQPLLIAWLFLPSFHFWTSFLSKDAIIFLMMALIIKTIETKKYRSITLYILVLISFFIRPYAVILIILSGLIVYMIYSKESIKRKLFYTLTLITSFFLILPILIKHYLKILSYNGFSDLISIFYYKVQNFHIDKGSHFINSNDYNYLERILIVLFRPFFFDASNIFQILSSIQNLIIIIYLILIMINKRSFDFKISHKFALTSAVLFLLVISTYIFNLGLASRMQVMIYPYFFYALTNFKRINEKK